MTMVATPGRSESLIDAVILDLGNVLVFHDNDYMARRLADRAGCRADDVNALFYDREFFGAINRGEIDADAIYTTVCQRLDTDLPRAEFEVLWSCHFRVNEPVLPVVEQLLKRLPVVLLSNTNVLHTAYLRPLLPILDRFTGLVFSHDAGMMKPQPEIYHLAAARAGVPPSRAAFFDDVPAYVDAATAQGLHGRVFNAVEQFVADLAELGVEVG